MNKKLIILSTLLAAATLARADVQPVSIFLSSDDSSGPSQYTVPAGKVFIPTHFQGFVTGSQPPTTQFRVIVHAHNIPPANSFASVHISDTFQNSIWVAIEKPFHLNAADRLAVPTNPSGGTYLRARYKGLLIDAVDVYAARIPLELEGNPRLNGNRLLADVKFASPRPRITKIESSSQAGNYAEDPTAKEQGGATRNLAEVSVDKGAGDRRFLRVTAKAIKK